MKPEDLKNSNDELKATSDNSEAANTPEKTPETKTEQSQPSEKKADTDDTKEESSVAEEKASEEKTEAKESDKKKKSLAEKLDQTVSNKEYQVEETEKAESSTEDEVVQPKEDVNSLEKITPEIKEESIVDEKEAPKLVAKEVEEKEDVISTEEVTPEVKEEPVADKKEETVSSEEKETPEVKEEEPADSDKEHKGVQKVEVTFEEQNEKVAEKSEDKPSRESVDYTSLNEVELINTLRDLLENHAEENIKADVDSIKVNFYKQHRAVADEEKKKFIEEGGVEDDFEPSNALYEEDLRNLMKEFRIIRSKQHRELEDEKEENLHRKYEIIDEIKNLVNRKESINKTFHEFRELQQEWREIGLVPQSKLKDLWENYHHHVENFYDYIKINRELRDLDLKKNLEAKIILCEKAEELVVEPSVIKAFNILQKYHEQWREIGPVPREKKEDLWERFKAATSKINKKHQAYFEDRKQDQKKNLEAKTALCEKAEEIANLKILNHKDWDKKSRELIELQKVWRTIGFAPKRDNNRIYERFRSACDKFFDAKREFYAQNKELQMNNMQMKTDLCVQAESLKDSTDWRKTTEEFIHIQKKWKEIGPVPRKHSDAIWKRFRAACDFFFDNKSKHFNHVDEEQVENLKLKKDLVAEVEAYKLTKEEDDDLAVIREFQRRWTNIGHVPFKDKDVVQDEFRDAINKHFDSLKIDDHKRNLLKFKTKMSNISGTTRGNNKMRYERDKYVSKLKQMESDLILLNNNIGFFANTKNAESLIEDVNKKIADTQEKIEFLKEKIRIIDSMEDED
ncbi:DUF349 domain-containing protein [uncultured Sunxiuqinia sp.]|uniref:DUF349 domain-containing protein n=1 Tax=uncultured Sunxiuqinia sp. TaxID=1573825 RepID=UPI002AA6DD09|nr:DUF349 domain-containing protein [uncultured Sunxiuqinia sp.]